MWANTYVRETVDDVLRLLSTGQALKLDRIMINTRFDDDIELNDSPGSAGGAQQCPREDSKASTGRSAVSWLYLTILIQNEMLPQLYT